MESLDSKVFANPVIQAQVHLPDIHQLFVVVSAGAIHIPSSNVAVYDMIQERLGVSQYYQNPRHSKAILDVLKENKVLRPWFRVRIWYDDESMSVLSRQAECSIFLMGFLVSSVFLLYGR